MGLDQPISACCFNHNGKLHASSYDWSKVRIPRLNWRSGRAKLWSTEGLSLVVRPLQTCCVSCTRPVTITSLQQEAAGPSSQPLPENMPTWGAWSVTQQPTLWGIWVIQGCRGLLGERTRAWQGTQPSPGGIGFLFVSCLGREVTDWMGSLLCLSPSAVVKELTLTLRFQPQSHLHTCLSSLPCPLPSHPNTLNSILSASCYSIFSSCPLSHSAVCVTHFSCSETSVKNPNVSLPDKLAQRGNHLPLLFPRLSLCFWAAVGISLPLSSSSPEAAFIVCVGHRGPPPFLPFTKPSPWPLTFLLYSYSWLLALSGGFCSRLPNSCTQAFSEFSCRFLKAHLHSWSTSSIS